VDLYIYSPIRLHGVVINYLRTGKTIPITNTFYKFAHSSYDLTSEISLHKYVIIVPPLLHIHLSPPLEVDDNSDQTAHYETLGL
jgi:hypothetical protein